jgi:hypothetical protein
MKQIGTVVVVILWWFDLKILIQSVPITTKVVSSNAAHGEVYLIPVSSTNTTDRHNIAEILLKVALNTITLTLTQVCP